MGGSSSKIELAPAEKTKIYRASEEANKEKIERLTRFLQIGTVCIFGIIPISTIKGTGLYKVAKRYGGPYFKSICTGGEFRERFLRDMTVCGCTFIIIDAYMFPYAEMATIAKRNASMIQKIRAEQATSDVKDWIKEQMGILDGTLLKQLLKDGVLTEADLDHMLASL